MCLCNALQCPYLRFLIARSDLSPGVLKKALFGHICTLFQEMVCKPGGIGFYVVFNTTSHSKKDRDGRGNPGAESGAGNPLPEIFSKRTLFIGSIENSEKPPVGSCNAHIEHFCLKPGKLFA